MQTNAALEQNKNIKCFGDINVHKFCHKPEVFNMGLLFTTLQRVLKVTIVLRTQVRSQTRRCRTARSIIPWSKRCYASTRRYLSWSTLLILVQ